MHLALRVVRDDVAQHPQVGGVHADDAVEMVVVRARDLPGLPDVERNAVLVETAPCGRVDRIADLLGRDGGRFDIIAVLEAAGAQQRLQDILRHRTAADVAVADK